MYQQGNERNEQTWFYKEKLNSRVSSGVTKIELNTLPSQIHIFYQTLEAYKSKLRSSLRLQTKGLSKILKRLARLY